MNAIRPIARTVDTVTFHAADYDTLISALEDAEDIAALFAAGAREEALGRAEARADDLPVELVERLLDGESPVRIRREHRALSSQALADASKMSPVELVNVEDGRETGSVAADRSLAAALGVPVDDLIASPSG